MPDRAPYSFGAAPLQNPIVGSLFLTEPWFKWFVDLQRYFLVRWDDLRFPVQGINPLGAVSDPGLDSNTGLLVFSGIQDNAIAGVAQMPHTWLPGSEVRPHIHLRFPTSAAADTRWQLQYSIADRNEDFPAAVGTYSTLPAVTIPNPQNVLLHVVGNLGNLDMTGFDESAVILWRMRRLANSDAADTDITDAYLMEVDFHYQVQKQGSVAEHPR